MRCEAACDFAVLIFSSDKELQEVTKNARMNNNANLIIGFLIFSMTHAFKDLAQILFVQF